MWLRHDLVKPSYWLAGWHGNVSRITSPLWWESFRQKVSLQKGTVMQSFDISLLLTRTSCWARCRVSGDLRHLNTPVTVLIQSYSFRQIFPSLTDYSHIVCELPLQWRQSERLWRLKSPASRLFAQPFVQAQITENIKAPRVRGIHRWPVISRTKGQHFTFISDRDRHSFPADGHTSQI